MRKIFLKSKTGSGGYMLLELLFYISFFLALSLAVISAMVTMARSFRETSVYTEMAQGGAIMERIGREIRNADDINALNSGNIKLNTTDDTGAAATVEFLLSGADVGVLENNSPVGNLNAPDLSVTALEFTQVSTVVGKAVKIHMSVVSENDKLGRTFDFYNTAVLRGNY